jgi:hypothetical protein
MTALFMCLVIMSVMASFLALVSSRYKITVRARSWNAALPLAEAGVEEALTHLQNDANATDNGWTASTVGGQPVNVKQRKFADGSYFDVTLYGAASGSPVIYSTGFVLSPLSINNYISRTVKIGGAKATASVNVGFGTIEDLQMNGKGVAVDSFNSSDPALSSKGQYDPTKTSKNGNLASVSGTVDLGNHSMAGSIYLNTGAKSVVALGQMSGTTYSKQKLSYPDVVLPKVNWLAAPVSKVANGKTVTTVHDFNLDGDYYVADSFGITVEPGVKVRVRLDTKSFDPSSINILSAANSSGSLTIYQVEGTVSLSGNATVNSGQARNFHYFGLPEVDNIKFSGNSTFIGVIYAPQADFTLSGGGSNLGFIGSSITKTISMNGNYNLHYDEDLGIAGSGSGGGGSSSTVTVNSWQEL